MLKYMINIFCAKKIRNSGRVWGIVPRRERGREFPKPIKRGLVRGWGRGWRVGMGMVLSYPAPTRPVAIPKLRGILSKPP